MKAFDYVPAHFRFVPDDGAERIMPVLQGEELSRWNARYARDLVGLLGIIQDATPRSEFRGVFEAARKGNDAIVDALIDYDKTGVLGGREWIEANLTIEQALLMVRRILAAHA